MFQRVRSLLQTHDLAHAKTSPNHKCNKCARPSTLSCAGCKGAPTANGGPPVCIWYCGPECQKVDWPKHKRECKSRQVRKILYRAGSTAQLAFYVFREVTFNTQIGAFERLGHNLILHGISYSENQSLVPFPRHKIRNENDIRAILGHRCAGAALIFMDQMIKTMLQGNTYSLAIDSYFQFLTYEL